MGMDQKYVCVKFIFKIEFVNMLVQFFQFSDNNSFDEEEEEDEIFIIQDIDGSKLEIQREVVR